MLTGFDSEMAQASSDAYGYMAYLDTLSATTDYGSYDGSAGGDGAFSFSSADALTVLDFSDLVMNGQTFSLTGRSGFDDQFIIRMSNNISFLHAPTPAPLRLLFDHFLRRLFSVPSYRLSITLPQIEKPRSPLRGL
jgi:hypothetical protein